MDAIDVFLDEAYANLDPHYKNLADLVKDPREGSDRIAFPICLDSTKVSIQYSNDYEFQKATFFRKLNDHFVTMTNASLPDGTIIMHSEAALHLSPQAMEINALLLECFGETNKQSRGVIHPRQECTGYYEAQTNILF